MRTPHSPSKAVETDALPRVAITPNSLDSEGSQFFSAFEPRDLANFREHLLRKGQTRTHALHPHSHARVLEGRIGSEKIGSPESLAPVSLAFVPPPPTLLPELASRQTRRIDRKMKLIRRSGLFGADMKGAKISRAATLDDLREAYKLVHRVYLGTGYIASEDAEIRFRLFETSNYTATFIAKKDGRVVGVLSIVRDSPAFGLPSDEVFSEELRTLRASKMRLVEVTNQAVDEEFRCTAVPTELMRCALAHSIEIGIDIGIAAVSPSHHSFYELLGFRKVGGERTYSGKVHDPVVPVQIDLDAHRHPRGEMDDVERFMHSFLTAENPYYLYVQAWENAAQVYFSEPHMIQSLLHECTDAQLQALHKHCDALCRKIAGPSFVKRLDPQVPDLRDLCAPAPDRLFVPAQVAESARLRDIDLSVACGRCAVDFSLPDAPVRAWKEGEERELAFHPNSEQRRFSPPEPPARRGAFRRARRIRDLLTVFWRHTTRKTPREAH